MTTRKKKKAEPQVHDYEVSIVWQRDLGTWYGIFTWYVDGQATVSITCATKSVSDCLRTLLEGMSTVQLDNQYLSQLQLPDQGDWQVRYYLDK